MIELSPPPIAAPVCPGTQNSDVWSRYLQRAFSILSEATQVQTVTSTTNSETLRYVPVGALVFYTYTGLGGLAFQIDGAIINIPATTISTTVSSFVIRG